MSADLQLKEIEDSLEDAKYRKFMITINNPEKHGYNRESIIELLREREYDYSCLSFEIGGEEHTPHFHVFIYNHAPIRITTIRKMFPNMHYDICNGTAQECRAYVFKQGKWEETEKFTTNDIDSHWEYGECPEEKPGKRFDIEVIRDAVKEGLTNVEIIDKYPSAIRYIDLMDRARIEYNSERYKYQNREDIHVTYIWGSPGTGKTSSVTSVYGFRKAYYVSDYEHPFDEYSGQEVIIFDEYHSNFKIDYFLHLLDVYPCQLNARFRNRWACYKKVYIISNISLAQQYKFVQQDDLVTYQALLRRIHTVSRYTKDDIITLPMSRFLKEEWHLGDISKFIPFE